MVDHVFGGDWTEQKLDALRAYLKAYRQIFTKNAQARYFKTIYIDAFAGTGRRKEPGERQNQPQLLDPTEDSSLDRYLDGSARIALSLDHPFDEYIFVDKNPDHAAELRRMVDTEYPQLAPRCRVWEADGCQVLHELAAYHRTWAKERAVVFLDPYGMNVEWDLIERIAQTKAMDMWLLWPLGMGANRLLPAAGKPNAAFAAKLNRMFGCSHWESFYQTEQMPDLFAGERSVTTKQVTMEEIGRFYLERLATVFAGVAPKVKMLCNSRGNPMYMLCFAASNPKGAGPAIAIADHLLKR